MQRADLLGEPHVAAQDGEEVLAAIQSFAATDQVTGASLVAIGAFQEATEILTKDVKPAAQYWLDDVKSKLTVEKVAEIASGKEVKWTMVPESTVKYAEFMHAVGSIKIKPASWKDLFFPEVHGLPGS